MTDTYFSDARELEADLVQFMQDIIRIPSLSSEEGAVIKRIHDEMLKLGYDEVRIDPMGNVLGRIGSGAKIIALDGHVDTVDVGAQRRTAALNILAAIMFALLVTGVLLLCVLWIRGFV